MILQLKSYSINRDVFTSNHTPPFPIRANRFLESLADVIRFPTYPKLPAPWTMYPVRACTRLAYLSRNYLYTPDHHRQHTLEHIRRKGNHFSIYEFKSPTGVGFAAVSSSETVQFSLPESASVFTAELCAICAAVEIIRKHPPKKFVIFSDSRSAIEALQSYCPRNPLAQQVKYMFHKLYDDGISVELCWIPAHIGIKGNENADKDAKATIHVPRSRMHIPVSDFFPILKQVFFHKWQMMWNEISEDNKLRQIKPTVDKWASSFHKDRRTELVLSHLLIGHTLLMHGFLMNTPHDPVPQCIQCPVPQCIQCGTLMTIKHILIDCPVFARQRMSSFDNKTIKAIFGGSPIFLTYPII